MKLEAKNIGFHVNQQRILEDVSFASKPGQLIGLIGPNGAGKSTLLRIMAGLLTPTSGHIVFDGHAISDITAKQRARKLAYMPQEHIVNWPISVYDLVAMGRLAFQHPLSALNFDSKEAIAAALCAMSIEQLAHRPANELSGGELARVLLARTLAQTPKILLADEPTAGLDPAHKLLLLKHLSKVSEDGMSVIMVLHDLTMAARFCQHIILLNNGCVYNSGAPRNVLTHQALRDVYHIKAHINEAGEAPVITPLEVVEPTS